MLDYNSYQAQLAWLMVQDDRSQPDLLGSMSTAPAVDTADLNRLDNVYLENFLIALYSKEPQINVQNRNQYNMVYW